MTTEANVSNETTIVGGREAREGEDNRERERGDGINLDIFTMKDNNKRTDVTT